MVSLIRPEPVAVLRPAVVRDELGEPVFGACDRTDLTAVVSPGATADLDASRPEGVTVAWTVHLPKTYQKPVRGCLIEVRGEACRVVGDPQPYTPEDTPGPWNYPVEVTRSDG